MKLFKMNRKQDIFVKDKSISFVVNCMKIVDGHKTMTVLAIVKQS